MGLISTVLWDVGGVLLTNGWDHVQRAAVLDHFLVERDEFEKRHAEWNDAWEKGTITIDHYLGETVFYKPRPFTQDEFVAVMQEQSQILPHTGLGVLKQLAAQDLCLAMLNNESRELNDYRVAKFGLIELFDCFISSCYVGLRKPDAKIFELALDLLQREPDEVVFVDDRQGNVDAAKAVGIHGIRHENAVRLAGALKALGIEAAG